MTPIAQLVPRSTPSAIGPPTEADTAIPEDTMKAAETTASPPTTTVRRPPSRRTATVRSATRDRQSDELHNENPGHTENDCYSE